MSQGSFPNNRLRPIRAYLGRGLTLLVPLVLAVSLASADGPLLIYDTDFRSDVDDVGGLATANALADLGMLELAGVVASTTGPYVVGAIDAVNTYYSRDDVPVGLIAPDPNLDTTRGNDDFAPILANTQLFISSQTNATAPISTDLYRQLLYDAPDDSVKIVVVGGQTAIHRLMQTGANYNDDGIGMTGMDLIQSRVSELVLMAGNFSNFNHAEFNVTLDVNAAQQVARNWPSPIVYSGFEVGSTIMTGSALTDPEINPVARAYEAYRGTDGGSGTIGDRQSWDQTAVLYAAAGTAWEGNTLWQRSDPHDIDFTDTGRALINANPDADRRFLIQSMSNDDIASIISDLMIAEPANPGPRPETPEPVGTLAHYRFDEGQGTVLTDRSDQAVAAALRNFADTSAGAGDDAPSGWTSDNRLRFDGVDDYIDTEFALNQLGVGSFTLETIFQYDGDSSRTWTPILGSSHGPSYSANEILFVGKRDGNDDLNINLAGLASFNVSSDELFDGEQRHLAVVFDHQAMEIRVFVDEALIHTRSGVAGPYIGSSRLLIGATGHAADERWVGWIDQVRITDEALEPAQFIPEPGTLGMLGLVGLMLLRRRQRT